MKINVDSCRVCEATYALMSIFSDDNYNIPEKLETCASIKVEITDQLPKYICQVCLAKLELAHDFRNQSKTTESKLRDMLSLQDDTDLTGVEDYIDSTAEENISTTPNNDTYQDCDIIEEPILNYDDLIIEEVETEDEAIANSLEIDTNESFEITGEKQFIEIENVPEEKICEHKMFSDKSNERSDVVVPLDETVEFEMEENESEEYLVQYNKENNSRTTTKTFVCDTCKASFTSYNRFRKHKKSHRYQCALCEKWFLKRYRLNNHNMRVHGPPSYVECNICDQVFSLQSNLDRHIRQTHWKERPYKCTTCNYAFARRTALQLHQRVHTDVKTHKCDICGNMFKDEIYLNSHKQTHIPIDQKRPRTKKSSSKVLKPSIKCMICGKLSANKSLHNNHVRTHAVETPYACKDCDKKFSQRQSLKIHELIHTGEKPYRCEVCGLSFRQNSHLKGHYLIHTGEQNYECQVCHRKFRHKSNLKVHQNICFIG